MTSSAISKASTAFLVLAGVGLLFASDAILPMIGAELSPASYWVGELVAAGWLGVAALNWLSRGTVLGGIHGRPVVFANLVLYFIAAMVCLRVAIERNWPAPLWVLGVATLLFSALYGWLLFRGPLGQVG